MVLENTHLEYRDDMTEQQFIIVKYGDNQEALFNPWCACLTLLEWIRKKCNCEAHVTIDLVDLNGHVINLTSRLREYACDVVNGRETYVLIRVEKTEETGPNQYVSLLNNLEEFNPELNIKLSNMSRPNTTKGRRERQKKTKPLKTRGESPAKRNTKQ